MEKTLEKMSQKKLQQLWLQAFELNSDFEELSDEDLVDLRDVLELRVKAMLSLLHNSVKEDMSEEEACDPDLIIKSKKLFQGVL